MRPCVHVETNVQGNPLAVEELIRQTEEKCAHEHEQSRGTIGSLQEREDGTSDASDEHDERDDAKEDSHFFLLLLLAFFTRNILHHLDCRVTS